MSVKVVFQKVKLPKTIQKNDIKNKMFSVYILPDVLDESVEKIIGNKELYFDKSSFLNSFSKDNSIFCDVVSKLELSEFDLEKLKIWENKFNSLKSSIFLSLVINQKNILLDNYEKKFLEINIKK
jgi:hypothetical protein